MPINSWNNAPSVLTEWIGRKDLITKISSDWISKRKQITGLIGFGGEGKSSLARKWIDALLNDSSQPQPDGVFWWGFYENRSVDEFLETAVKYISGGKIDLYQFPSSNFRAQILGAMLNAGRYLFILDGLEVLQYQEGDQYGLLQSNDLRDLLTFFARPDNQSFCLITSRAPLLDLMEYTTYTHRDVDRLSEKDGRALLRKLGVQGSSYELNKVVTDWDGHALTLSILGTYLTERFNGNIHHLAEIPIPTVDEPRYERVHRVLRRYDEHLMEEEREFLKLFSVFRLPVQESAFEKIFEPLLKNAILNSQFANSRVSSIVNHLVAYRIIRHDEHAKTYTIHPLIRNHYFAIFTQGESSSKKNVHLHIKEYYLSIIGETSQNPTFEEIKPVLELIHHACSAGAYDEAHSIRYERLDQGRFVIGYQLGAYDTYLNVLLEFFPDGDATQEPQVSEQSTKRFVLHETGLSLMNLGRLREVLPLYKQANKLCLASEDWRNASKGFRNLAGLHVYLGALDESAEAAHQALDLARKVDDKFQTSQALSYQGRTAHLQGKIEAAKNIFSEAEQINRYDDQFGYFYIYYADYLYHIGDLDYSRHMAETNLQISERNHWEEQISWSHRILGDLDSETGNQELARAHYISALKIARSISDRRTLIEALLARGRFLAIQIKDFNAAFSDLNEVVGYCLESGYRIYEADVRVALAWAYLANGEKEKARQSAERALQMSNEMGYHWGKVDAEEVLKAISG